MFITKQTNTYFCKKKGQHHHKKRGTQNILLDVLTTAPQSTPNTPSSEVFFFHLSLFILIKKTKTLQGLQALQPNNNTKLIIQFLKINKIIQ